MTIERKAEKATSHTKKSVGRPKKAPAPPITDVEIKANLKRGAKGLLKAAMNIRRDQRGRKGSSSKPLIPPQEPDFARIEARATPSTTDFELEKRMRRLEEILGKDAPIRALDEPSEKLYALMASSCLPDLGRLPRSKRAFLHAFAETLSITEASRRVGYHFSSHFYWMKSDETYAECFAAVKSVAIQSLEDEAVRRAKEGYLTPVVSAGKLVTYERKYDSSLMVKLLQRFSPNEYKDRSSRELTGAEGGPVDLNLQSDLGKAIAEHLERLKDAVRNGVVQAEQYEPVNSKDQAPIVLSPRKDKLM
jgi:hypothetical protein